MKEREWLAVFVMSALLAGMAIKSIKNEESIWPHHFGQKTAVPHKIITVNIRGAVKNPGRYHLPEGSKIQDLIEAATLEENADLSRLEGERILKKGQRVYVPQRKAHKKVR
jgi:DNA uptake protein ComE-like DNA-binding protein